MRRYPIALPACALIIGVLLALASAAAASAQTPTPPTPPLAASSTQAVPAQVTVVVQVSNGTAGSALPAQIPVRLYGIDGQAAAFTKDGVTDASGKARFEGVPYQSGRTFAVTGEVGRTTYVTPLTPAKPGETAINLPLRIYATTTDASQVRIDQMYVVGEFVAQDKLQLINVYTLSNGGDRTVEGGQTAPDGRPATLRFDLPAGAAEVAFQGDDGKIYARTDDGGFLYTQGLQPGAATLQVAVRYTLPYSGQLHLAPSVRYPVGVLNVLLADQGVKLAAPQLKAQGTQARQDGTQFRVYTAEALRAGAAIPVDLSGAPSLASPAPAAAPATARAPAKKVTPAGLREQAITLFTTLRDEGGVGLLVSLLGVAIVFASGLHWLLQRRAARLALDPAARRRALAEAVVDLEEDYTAGKVEEQEYTQRRGLLQEALIQLC